MSLADRFLRMVAPINVGDSTLAKLVTAVTAPGELMWQIVRGDSTFEPWERVFDPQAAPAPLLGWLSKLPGVEFLPDDTEAQKRYRIDQAAGFYQGTPRALVEELQLLLTGTRTVLLGFHNGDQWHYLVGYKFAEASAAGTVAVSRAIERQNPAGMTWDEVLTSDWSSFMLGPDLVASRAVVDGVDSYVIEPPDYPTCQSVLDSFATCQDLLDNDPI